MDRSVKIEAAEVGSVILDANVDTSTGSLRRVLKIAPGSSGVVVTLIGLGITGGYLGTSAAEQGAGVLIAQCAPHCTGFNVTLDRCDIYSNVGSFGGGLSMFANADAVVIDSNIYDNYAISAGGGWLGNAGHLMVIRTDIYANYGGGGGGCAAQGGKLTVIRSVFSNNTASDRPIQGQRTACWTQLYATAIFDHTSFRDHDASSKHVISMEADTTWICPLGKWMVKSGNINANFEGCLYECLPGSYGESPYLSAPDQCTACPDGTSSVAGASSLDACACPSGRYNDALPGSGGVSCVECPLTGVGTDCASVAAGTPVTLNNLPLKSNHWRASNSSAVIRRCHTPGVCLGGNRSCSDVWCNAGCGDASWCTGEGSGVSCAEGHTGPFCEARQTSIAPQATAPRARAGTKCSALRFRSSSSAPSSSASAGTCVLAR